MDAFRPFGGNGIRFPKPRHDGAKPSFAFVDFNTHDEARACLSNLNGEAVVCSIMLTLKWSSSPNQRPHLAPHGGGALPPPPPRRNRLTEAEAADSTTLFLRLPPTLPPPSYPDEMETLRLLVQGTMEEELNVGVSLDAPERITAKDEPALRVTVRHPKGDMNYGFLEFCSHAAATTTLVALTGHEDGGAVREEKLRASCLITEEMEKRDLSHLQGVALFWAKGGGGQTTAHDGRRGPHGMDFHPRHFPPDSRTDCWFCLASPTCEKHLIVAVHDQCYVAMPKGAVNESHVLIVPVEHSSDGAMVNRKLAPEMATVKAQLRDHARNVLGLDLFVFERCIQTKGGYHTHVQCVPVARDSGPAIQSKMLDMASRAGFALKEITSDLGLTALEDDWSAGYFYAEIPLPGGGDEVRRFIYRASAGDGTAQSRGGTVPLQFGREVLAQVLENADIGQWKACVVSQEKEEELTAKFRTSLSNVST
jgi:diadenosine tetraphosphate (Ap4A) HIT family hydrolase